MPTFMSIRANYVMSRNGLVEASTSADQKRKRLAKPEPLAPDKSLPDLSSDFKEVKITPGKNSVLARTSLRQTRKLSSTSYK